MIIRNTQYHPGIDFESYLALPGISYSGIKGFQGAPSAGMRLGTKVHNYLLEPSEYCWEDVNQVKAIAAELRRKLGPALAVLDKELAFTCEMHYNWMVLEYKGRSDLMKAGRIVVDLKILSGPLIPAIDRFGYQDQISGYCLATGSPVGLIIAWNKARQRVENETVRPTQDFWNYQIVHRGKPSVT